MKIFILYYVSLIQLGEFLSYAQAADAIDVDEISQCEDVSHQVSTLKSTTENLRRQIQIIDEYFDIQWKHQKNIEGKVKSLEDKFRDIEDRLTEQQTKNQNEMRDLIQSLKPQNNSESLASFEKAHLLSDLQEVSLQQEDILENLDNDETILKRLSRSVSSDNHEVSVGASMMESTPTGSCWGGYTNILNELNKNMTYLQSIDMRIKQLKTEHEQEVKEQKEFNDIPLSLLRFLNIKEPSQFCVKSSDDKLLCTLETYPTSCAHYDSKHCADGKCRTQPIFNRTETFLVACDDTTDGGGWTIIQRRINGSVDFYRDWSQYKDGFGDINGEYWLGLDKIHVLTTTLTPTELLIQMKDHNDTIKYAKYDLFLIGSADDLYELTHIGGYKGDAGDAFSHHKGQKFSTTDKDNDSDESYNCAVDKRGAWWYNKCQWANLNGLYYENGQVPKNETGRGINWATFHGYNYSLKFVQMMIRPRKI